MGKVKKTCSNCWYAWDGVCVFAGEISTDCTCEKWTKMKKLTCESCDDINQCEYANDPYNTNGDCLMMK